MYQPCRPGADIRGNKAALFSGQKVRAEVLILKISTQKLLPFLPWSLHSSSWEEMTLFLETSKLSDPTALLRLRCFSSLPTFLVCFFSLFFLYLALNRWRFLLNAYLHFLKDSYDFPLLFYEKSHLLTSQTLK